MSLSTDKTPSSKMPRKRLFGKGTCGLSSIPNFKRSRPVSVREFPKFCGLIGTDEVHKTSDFFGAVAATPLRVVPRNYEKSGGGADDKFHSPKGDLNNSDVTIPEKDAEPKKDSTFSKAKSIGDDDDDDDDDDCVIIEEKSSNIVDKNQVIPENSNQDKSKRWEFEWVEVRDDDDDEISLVTPPVLQKGTQNVAEPWNKLGNQEMKSKESEKVHEALVRFHEVFTKLLVEKQGQKGNRQVHTRAAMMLREENKWVNTEPCIGHIPGVEIGHQFQFRAELVVVGLHHEFIRGIHSVVMDGTDYAISVVDSSRYENRVESSNVLIYSGQGGGNPNAQYMDKKLEDQKLEGDNLALKNSMDAKLPLRVIRRIELESRKRYTYDGIYIVTKYWPERSEAGKIIYMFKMVRMQGQEEDFSGNHLKRRRRRTVISEDVSQGKEKTEIMVVNEINDEKPDPFTYITKMIYSSCLHQSSVLKGCDCFGGCSDCHPCPCLTKNNDGEIPFNEAGAILRPKKMIYECGPNCKCPPSCHNRVSQHGPKLPLEVFRTKSTGWGVRSREMIMSGSFICEYLGELLEDKAADQRENDQYLFDLDDGEGFTIDAAEYGNVSRFINHCCSPNLYAQNVLYDHHDKKLPRVMLFATQDIPALVELTYDYNYKIDRVRDANGKIRKKKCYCGARSCTGRLY